MDPINKDAIDKDALAAQTIAIYEREGPTFDAQRPRVLFERPWLDRLTEKAPAGGSVLDVGCGAGEPIAAHYIDNGFALTGVDGAASMLEIARSRWPDGRWVQADMRALALDKTFDAVLAWDSFFHLTAQDQRTTLPRLAAHVANGGRLLLTVGHEPGTAIGRVGNSPIFHASLALSEYAAILEQCGLRVIAFAAEDPGCNYHTVLLAERPSPKRTP